MTKSTNKKAVTDTAKTSINWTGLPKVVHLIAELIAVYTFTTQDNQLLVGVGAILGLHAAYQLASKFMVNSNS